MEIIKPYLSTIYSPFNKKDTGNQGHLFPINKHAFNII